MKITEIETNPKMRMDEMGSYYYDDDEPLRQWSVESDSGKTYTVMQTSNDETTEDKILRTFECDCPAGSHKRLCKHINAVIDWIDDRTNN